MQSWWWWSDGLLGGPGTAAGLLVVLLEGRKLHMRNISMWCTQRLYARWWSGHGQALIKKKIKFSSYIQKFRVEQFHIWGKGSLIYESHSYGKCPLCVNKTFVNHKEMLNSEKVVFENFACVRVCSGPCTELRHSCFIYRLYTGGQYEYVNLSPSVRFTEKPTIIFRLL